jgi:hypothetical protein
MRLTYLLLLANLIGCGGSATWAPDEGGSGDAGGGGAAVSNSGGSGAGTAGGGGSPPVEPGPEWTVPPGHTYSSVSCDGQVELFVEIWQTARADCVPASDVAGILVLGVQNWDMSPGTFVIGQATEQGEAMAADLSGPDEVTGTLTIEPFEDEPTWFSWDLSVGSGTTDLSLCGHFDAFPCSQP